MHHSSHCQTRSSGFFSSVLSPPRDTRNVTGHTGTLGELVGSHTKVVIYPAYAICCESDPALPDNRFEGIQVVNYLTNYQTTKVILTKGVPHKSGHMQINKTRHTVLLEYTPAP